jgi:hypothetical protein
MSGAWVRSGRRMFALLREGWYTKSEPVPTQRVSLSCLVSCFLACVCALSSCDWFHFLSPHVVMWSRTPHNANVMLFGSSCHQNCESSKPLYLLSTQPQVFCWKQFKMYHCSRLSFIFTRLDLVNLYDHFPAFIKDLHIFSKIKCVFLSLSLSLYKMYKIVCVYVFMNDKLINDNLPWSVDNLPLFFILMHFPLHVFIF